MSERVIELDEDGFTSEVLNAELPVLVDMWAPWCGPCRFVSPVLEELAEENDGRLKVCKLNVDDAPGIAQKYGVMAIPTVFLFSKGEEVARMVGVQPKQTYQDAIDKVAGG